MDAAADPSQRQPTTRMLPSHVSSHKRTNAGRVDIGNARKINHESLRVICSHRGLEFEHRTQNQRAIERQNTMPRLGSGPICNTKDILRHAGDINAGVTLDC